MTVVHLQGYFFLTVLAALLLFAAFAEPVTGLVPWVRRLMRTQADWRRLRVDIAKVAQEKSVPNPIGSRLEDLYVLPASHVFMQNELDELESRYHAIRTRQTWKVLGASAFPRDRVYEVANHLRIYVILFLVLVGINVMNTFPESADLTPLFSGTKLQILHAGAGFVGERLGRIFAIKEALIAGFFCARLYSERSIFLHFARD
jgi:hypothetical protein